MKGLATAFGEVPGEPRGEENDEDLSQLLHDSTDDPVRS